MNVKVAVRLILLSVITVTASLWAESTIDLDRLAGWMIGSFSSAEQAALDTEFRDIRLEVVRIWPQRDDGYWLYVEQATAEALDKPYRQRVYHLRGLDAGYIESSVYTIKNDSVFAGAWRSPEVFLTLPLDSLDLREGCSIVLRPFAEFAFVGNTIGRVCESSLRGAAYALSEVEIYADRMISWDRGFDAAGKQVWGATRGGYVFKKIVR